MSSIVKDSPMSFVFMPLDMVGFALGVNVIRHLMVELAPESSSEQQQLVSVIYSPNFLFRPKDLRFFLLSRPSGTSSATSPRARTKCVPR